MHIYAHILYLASYTSSGAGRWLLTGGVVVRDVFRGSGLCPGVY